VNRRHGLATVSRNVNVSSGWEDGIDEGHPQAVRRGFLNKHGALRFQYAIHKGLADAPSYRRRGLRRLQGV
jgi:hypothetical protein